MRKTPIDADRFQKIMCRSRHHVASAIDRDYRACDQPRTVSDEKCHESADIFDGRELPR